jgi:hypothetical protein
VLISTHNLDEVDRLADRVGAAEHAAWSRSTRRNRCGHARSARACACGSRAPPTHMRGR